MAESLHDKKLILYDSPNGFALSYQRFYNNSILLSSGEYNTSSFDYVLHFSEYEINKYNIMQDLYLNLGLVNQSGVVWVYEIIR